MTAIKGDGAEAIRTLARIDAFLRSDKPSDECALLISQEVMKFKAKTDVLTMNPGQAQP